MLVKLGSRVQLRRWIGSAHADLSENLPGRSAGCLFSSSSINQGLSWGGKLFHHLTHDGLRPGVSLALLENRPACLCFSQGRLVWTTGFVSGLCSDREWRGFAQRGAHWIKGTLR